MEEKRNIGVDVGTRRIGVAVSDPSNSMALPHETVEARPLHAAVARVLEIARSYDAAAIVVGWPVDMSGKEGRAVRSVKQFLEHLDRGLKREHLLMEVHRWDERLTTRAAESLLIEADVSRRKRKDTVDQIAAAHILQGYLDSLRIAGARVDDGIGDGVGGESGLGDQE